MAVICTVCIGGAYDYFINGEFPGYQVSRGESGEEFEKWVRRSYEQSAHGSQLTANKLNF